MPSLFRFLLVIGVLGGIGYAGIVTLAKLVDPQPREITVTIPQEKLLKHPLSGSDGPKARAPPTKR